MKKSILGLKGIQILNVNEQKSINGGGIFGNDPCALQEACCGKPGNPPCRLK